MKIFPELWKETQFNCPEQKQSAHQLLICRCGSGVVTAGAQDYILEPNTLLLIPAGTAYRRVSPNVCQCGIIRFAPEDAVLENCCISREDHDQIFGRLFDLAIGATVKDNPFTHAFSAAIGDALLALLSSFSTVQNSISTSIVDYIDSLIRQNLANSNFDLTDEIKKTGYNVSYFRRIYRETIGRPPQAQLIRLRLEYAKSLMQLTKSGKTVRQYSLESGFSDSYYFSRVFKQHEGVSPSEYLEACSRPGNVPVACTSVDF